MRGRKDVTEAEVAHYMSYGFTAEAARRWARNLRPEVGPEVALRLKALGWNPTAIKDYLKSVGNDRGKPEALDLHGAEVLLACTQPLGGPKIVLHWSRWVHHALATDLGDRSAITVVLEVERWLKQFKSTTGYEIAWTVKFLAGELTPAERDGLVALASEPGFKDIWRRGDYHAAQLAKSVGSPANLAFLNAAGFSVDDRIFNAYLPITEKCRGFDSTSASPAEGAQWLRALATTWYWFYEPWSEVPYADQDRERVRLILDDALDPIRFRDVILDHDGHVHPVALEGIVKGNHPSAIADGYL